MATGSSITENAFPDNDAFRIESVFFKAQREDGNMLHRHLNQDQLTIAAIDDVIARGKRVDWLELQQVFLDHPIELREKILAACLGHLDDPYEQRYRLWKLYAERKIT